MNRSRLTLAACCLIANFALSARADEPGDNRLQPWQSGVSIRPVSSVPGRHTIHSYYVCNPESPDGRQVLFYSSLAANGHTGDICFVDRLTGSETTVARNVSCEDAHRAACQQWISGGRRVAFHEVRDGRWYVVVVDAQTLERRDLAADRQLAFGAPRGDWLPIYGCHWDPGEHRDLELVNAATGEIKTAVRATDVERAYPDWLAKEFGDKRTSLFFPVLSPDGRRVFFKIAAGNGGSVYQSKAASHRQGLIGYDLERGQLTFQRAKWGHPAWHPDSRRVIEMGNILIDAEGGAVTKIPSEPYLSGSHPSVSPDGKLFVTDGLLGDLGDEPKQWGVMVGDLRGTAHQVLHRFDNSRGAKSWRVSHPHPAFSADNRRVYFNVSNSEWTTLYVAEAGGAD
ncbi:MAG: hypothetical protein JSS27_01395 [Planctomycetes bacterium]|nr:hypothetical protein [Planctomycetota bacterium]